MTSRDRNPCKNGTAPLGSDREGLYSWARYQDARVSLPCADVGNEHRTQRPFRQTPLRPSEGLVVTFPIGALSAATADRPSALNGRAGKHRRGTWMASRQTWGPGYGPVVERRSGSAEEQGLSATGIALVTDGTLERKVTSVNVPASLDAERRVLGTLLVFYTRDAVDAVKAAGLKPDCFYWRGHEAVYRAILTLDARDKYADALTVSRFLAGQRHSTFGTWLERIGGQAKLDELSAHADANGFLPCARLVVEDGRWRRWLTCTREALAAIEVRDEDAFWAAVGHVREDVPAGTLRVIPGESEAA